MSHAVYGSAIIDMMTFLAVGVAADFRYGLCAAGLTGAVAAATPKTSAPPPMLRG